jgi:hypothetical protein
LSREEKDGGEEEAEAEVGNHQDDDGNHQDDDGNHQDDGDGQVIANFFISIFVKKQL